MSLLFHYCSSATLLSILRSKTMRLSSVSLSNDTQEGRLVSGVVGELAKRDRIGTAAQDQLREALTTLEQIFDGLAFCLSEAGDLLSQWRAYADDGAGFSIGFDQDGLVRLAEASKANTRSGFTLQQVIYKPDEHRKAVEPTYQKIRELAGSSALQPRPRSLLDTRTEQEITEDIERFTKASSDLRLRVMFLFAHLYTLKSPAFAEEREWRLLSYSIAQLGGADQEECDYRVFKSRIIPFRDYSFAADLSVVREVVLGPKNETPVLVMQNFLTRFGYNNVEVRRSAASYR